MNIIVTGASRGIGFEIARKFAAEDNHNVLVISRNQQNMDLLQRKCLQENPESSLHILRYDLENLEDMEAELMDLVSEHIDSLDILVNNAGFLVKQSAGSIGLKDAERMMRINCFAPLFLVRSLLPLLEKADNPHVLNIGSMAGVQGGKKFPGLAVYSASKGALHVLTECLAEEYAERSIRFNSLALGAVQTEMLGEAFPGMKAPLDASEMAGFITEFALKGHQYFNGKILPVSIGTP